MANTRIDARPRNRWDTQAGVRMAHRDTKGNVIGGYGPDGRGFGNKADGGTSKGLGGGGLSAWYAMNPHAKQGVAYDHKHEGTRGVAPVTAVASKPAAPGPATAQRGTGDLLKPAAKTSWDSMTRISPAPSPARSMTNVAPAPAMAQTKAGPVPSPKPAATDASANLPTKVTGPVSPIRAAAKPSPLQGPKLPAGGMGAAHGPAVPAGGMGPAQGPAAPAGGMGPAQGPKLPPKDAPSPNWQKPRYSASFSPADAPPKDYKAVVAEQVAAEKARQAGRRQRVDEAKRNVKVPDWQVGTMVGDMNAGFQRWKAEQFTR